MAGGKLGKGERESAGRLSMRTCSLSHLLTCSKLVGRLGFAPSSRRLRAGTSLSKFATLIAVRKDRDTKAEFEPPRRSYEASPAPGFRVAENGIPCWNRTSLCGFANRRLNCSANGI